VVLPVVRLRSCCLAPPAGDPAPGRGLRRRLVRRYRG
jgi:hypothetical protein